MAEKSMKIFTTRKQLEDYLGSSMTHKFIYLPESTTLPPRKVSALPSDSPRVTVGFSEALPVLKTSKDKVPKLIPVMTESSLKSHSRKLVFKEEGNLSVIGDAFSFEMFFQDGVLSVEQEGQMAESLTVFEDKKTSLFNGALDENLNEVKLTRLVKSEMVLEKLTSLNDFTTLYSTLNCSWTSRPKHLSSHIPSLFFQPAYPQFLVWCERSIAFAVTSHLYPKVKLQSALDFCQVKPFTGSLSSQHVFSVVKPKGALETVITPVDCLMKQTSPVNLSAEVNQLGPFGRSVRVAMEFFELNPQASTFTFLMDFSILGIQESKPKRLAFSVPYVNFHVLYFQPSTHYSNFCGYITVARGSTNDTALVFLSFMNYMRSMNAKAILSVLREKEYRPAQPYLLHPVMDSSRKLVIKKVKIHVTFPHVFFSTPVSVEKFDTKSNPFYIEQQTKKVMMAKKKDAAPPASTLPSASPAKGPKLPPASQPAPPSKKKEKKAPYERPPSPDYSDPEPEPENAEQEESQSEETSLMMTVCSHGVQGYCEKCDYRQMEKLAEEEMEAYGDCPPDEENTAFRSSPPPDRETDSSNEDGDDNSSAGEERSEESDYR